MKLIVVESYEYRVVPFDAGRLNQAALNQEGREGWLLVATFPHIVFSRKLPSVKTVEDLSGRRMLTVKEAAELIGVGRTKMHDMVWKGQIKTVKIGRCVRILSEDMETFIRQQAQR